MGKCVAIHQPNYFPWLGYFFKIARSDIFVFLDDVQFSKGGFTNRVKILSPSGGKWLTIPVRVSLGQVIYEIGFSTPRWRQSHVDTLRNAYADAPSFKVVWPEVRELILEVGGDNLAEININLLIFLVKRLGLRCQFLRSSALEIKTTSDQRLVDIVLQTSPGGTYLSGRGGAEYQDPARFRQAGLDFIYTDYLPRAYPQLVRPGHPNFVAGLSILDAIFHLGWLRTQELILGETL